MTFPRARGPGDLQEEFMFGTADEVRGGGFFLWFTYFSKKLIFRQCNGFKFSVFSHILNGPAKS